VSIHTKFPGVSYIHTESLNAPPAARHIVHVIGVDNTRITGRPSATYATNAVYVAQASRGVRRRATSSKAYTSTTAASCQR
jgi:hypothetical protein